MVVAGGNFLKRYRAAGNRLWREDMQAAGQSADADELYTYDGAYRLTKLQRGDVTTGGTPTIGSRNFQEYWTLGHSGN